MAVTHALHVRYFAAARDAAGVSDDVVTIDPGSDGTVTVAAIREIMLRRRPELATVLKQSRLAINQRFVGDGDSVIVASIAEVAVIPPVAGG